MNNNKLNPYYVTGFTDAEGCFNVTISPRSNGKYQASLRFEIDLHSRDIELLSNIQSFYKGVGTLTASKNNSLVKFVVRNFDDIYNIIIPHFDKYPLLSKKKADFLLFKEIALLMKDKEHLTNEGLLKIVAIKASMNLGLSEKLSSTFPVKPHLRPKINTLEIPDPNWIAGFSDGDGSFFINIAKTNSKLGHSIKLMFRLAQHDRDLNLFNLIIQYFNCGTIQRKAYSGSQAHVIDLNVSKFNDIYTKIIPFFKEFNLKSIKSLDFIDFCEVADLMNKSIHLTPEGILRIITIKARMNNNRKD